MTNLLSIFGSTKPDNSSAQLLAKQDARLAAQEADARKRQEDADAEAAASLKALRGFSFSRFFADSGRKGALKDTLG